MSIAGRGTTKAKLLNYQGNAQGVHRGALATAGKGHGPVIVGMLLGIASQRAAVIHGTGWISTTRSTAGSR